MKNLKIPDTTRLIADVLPPGELPRPEINAFGHIEATHIEPDISDLSLEGQFYGLELRGFTRYGENIRTVRIPEGCLFQAMRGRIAAVLLSGRLVVRELVRKY